MFTGIIEEVGEVTHLEKDRGNLQITVKANMASQLKIDQSVAHNGVCLTVIEKNNTSYRVTAIEETLKRSNLEKLQVGSPINLERGMLLSDRLDGHIVQGHVDQTGICKAITKKEGSTIFSFEYNFEKQNVTIEKGSITINGVSLTVVRSQKGAFNVAIIPYTFEHTTFKHLKEGNTVNLEFDVIGKYVKRLMALNLQ